MSSRNVLIRKTTPCAPNLTLGGCRKIKNGKTNSKIFYSLPIDDDDDAIKSTHRHVSGRDFALKKY
jgi:hypothetical protein